MGKSLWQIYEVIDRDYEFMKDGEPTGHYARGVKLGSRGTGYDVEYKLKLLCNLDEVWVRSRICKLIN